MNRSRTRPLIPAMLTIIVIVGCQQCGELSPKAYELGAALYSVCNLEDESRLEKVKAAIFASSEASEITESEKDSLLAIVEKAGENQWHPAMLDARTLMSEQVRN